MTRSDDSLTSPFRAVRPIAAPADGPWPGMLTGLPSGERAVLVDADTLGPHWGGWDAAPDGHVLAPLDIVRIQGGHEVMLPVCPESLDAFVTRRNASGRPLARGEAVTIGVSLLRGCAEVLGRAPTSGAWWLTETGRPVFATDASATPVLGGTATLLDTVARAAPHATAWTDAASALSAVRLSAAELDRAEQELFTIAAPAPLELSSVDLRGPAAPAVRVGADDVHGHEPRRGLWEYLARHVDADLADLVSRTTTSVWRRTRTKGREGRRAPLFVAGGVAAAVLAVGLMWPGATDGAATAEGVALPGDGLGAGAQSTATPSAQGDPADDDSRSPAPTPSGGASPADDLEAEAAELLEELDTCGEDSGCRAEIAMDGQADRLQPMRVVGDRRSIALLDDFGDIAVLRVDDTSRDLPSQLVVIARHDGEWLLRDVHDATQQPR